MLLLDEPSLGLAPRIVEQLREVIAEINRQGVTVVLVEQNAAMALAVADRAVVLEVGQVALEGTRRRAGARATRCATATSASLPAAGAQPAAARRRTDRRRRAPRRCASSSSTASPSASAASARSPRSRSRVAPGSMHALIGPNGAGKSTLPERAQRRLPRDRRQRALRRQRAHAAASRTRSPRLGVARTFQNLALSPGATVLDNLLVARHRLHARGLRRRRAAAPERAPRARSRHEARVREIAALLGAAERRPPRRRRSPTAPASGSSSRGRCAPSRGCCCSTSRSRGWSTTSRWRWPRRSPTRARELGISVLLVEHDMAFVMGIADRVTVLDFGRRIADGTPAEVQQRPRGAARLPGRWRSEPVRRRCWSAACSWARSTRSSRSGFVTSSRPPA